ncbi:hypothetical protein IscW_ISCW011652, partial [Ixodes scapularis]
PNFKQFTAIGPNVVIFEFLLKTLHLKKPIYAGFSILEVSKVVMYDCLYNQSRRVFTDARAVYSKPDYFILQISGRDVDENVADLTESQLDTCGCMSEHALYLLQNKKRLG